MDESRQRRGGGAWYIFSSRGKFVGPRVVEGFADMEQAYRVKKSDIAGRTGGGHLSSMNIIARVDEALQVPIPCFREELVTGNCKVFCLILI